MGKKIYYFLSSFIVLLSPTIFISKQFLSSGGEGIGFLGFISFIILNGLELASLSLMFLMFLIFIVKRNIKKRINSIK